jgi:hypothetical protein
MLGTLAPMNRPELITIQLEAGQPVKWKCSDCSQTFDIYRGAPAAEEKARVLREQFDEHLKVEHGIE